MEMLMPDEVRDVLEQYVAGLITTKSLYSSFRIAVGPDVFEGTRSCWENMKSRCKDGYAHLSSEFEKLPDFIRHMGFRPFSSASIHRKNNDLGYSPENCVWANKKTQSRERSNTVMLTCDGLTLPLVEWAERKSTNPSVMRRRQKLGWSDEEIVKGRNFKALNNLLNSLPTGFWGYTPWPTGKEMAWEQEYQSMRGNGEHRLDFYISTIKKQINRHAANLERAAMHYGSPGEYATSDQIPEWEKLSGELDKWHTYHRDAHKKMAMLANKQRPRFADVPERISIRLAQLARQAKQATKSR
jgi:hypothetical protein